MRPFMAGVPAFINWTLGLAILFPSITIFSVATAQTTQDSPALKGSSGDSHSSTGSIAGLASEDGEGASGGASMADFGSLMNLIQQTIDPDSWIDAGGTSSMLQYPAGVFVDPRGQLQRSKETRASISFPKTTSSGPRHPWRTESTLRTVSLRRLNDALSSRLQHGLIPSTEMRQLAGLSRIEVIKVDAANEDVLLAGPASGGVPGFTLEDLAIMMACASVNAAPLGCSIDPSDAGLLAAQKLVAQPGSIERLARDPRNFTARLQDEIGPHGVRVFGINPMSGTALALVDADEHMKRLGFGLEPNTAGISTYFDFLEQQADVPQQSLVRWWFAYNDSPIRANSQSNVYQLPDQCVQVMSEQQWVTQQGRAASGQQDKAADAFAAEMTAHLNELRALHPSYARLCAVFELALALQVAIESTGQPSLEAWFPQLHALGGQSPDANRPETVGGLTTWHRLRNGTVVAVVSGGVTIDARSIAAESNWQDSQFLSTSAVPNPPAMRSTSHEHWWWD